MDADSKHQPGTTSTMDKHLGSPVSDPEEKSPDHDYNQRRSSIPLDQIPKSRWERSWPTIACGAGLFSDGRIIMELDTA